jgi:tetratricopeptide (TPR) repeat protein
MSLQQCCALGRCAGTKDLKKCSACSEVFYCSKEHQIEHFKENGHKLICPGKTKGKILAFADCAQRAQKCFEEKMWLSCICYYGAMLELTERSVGLFHPQVGSLLEILALCYKMLEKWNEAIGCLQKVVMISEIDDTTDSKVKDAKLFNTMGQLSEFYLQAGQIDLAKQLLLKIEEQAKSVFGENSFERGRALCALAGCYERNNEIDVAVTTLLEAINIKAYGDCREKVEMISASNAFYNLGVLYLGMENKVESSKQFKKALQMKIKGGLPSDHTDIIETKNYILQTVS